MLALMRHSMELAEANKTNRALQLFGGAGSHCAVLDDRGGG